MSADHHETREQTVSPQDDALPHLSGQRPHSTHKRRLWSREDVLDWMVRYIRRHANLPSRSEYLETQDDGPDESTIRLRLGTWKDAWRTALQVILDESTVPQEHGHGPRAMVAEPETEATQDLRVAVLEGLRGGLRPFELARDLRVPRALIISIRDELRLSLPEPDLGRARRTKKPPNRRALERHWTQATWPASTMQLTRLVYGPNPTAKERARMRVRLSTLVRMGRLKRTGRDRYELP